MILVIVAWAFANWVTMKVNFPNVAQMIVCTSSSDDDLKKKVDKYSIPATYWGQLVVILLIFFIYIYSANYGDFSGGFKTTHHILQFLAFIVVVATYGALCTQTKSEEATVGTEQECASNSGESSALLKDALGSNAALLAVSTFALASV